MTSKPTHHGIDYIEFVATNLNAVKAFYGEAFGWSFNDYGPEYTGIKIGDNEVGGFRVDSKVVPGGPLVVLFSENLEQSVLAVQRAGGKISKEPFTFPGGRRFHFLDPSGNELGVWSKS